LDKLCLWHPLSYMHQKKMTHGSKKIENHRPKVRSRARLIICIICIISKYRYRYIGSDIVNICIGIISIGICYNYIIGYDIVISIKSGFNRYNEISVSVFYRYIGVYIIIGIGIGIGLISNSRK
jgi:hypothetical protein